VKKFKRYYAFAFVLAILVGLLLREFSITRFEIVRTSQASSDKTAEESVKTEPEETDSLQDGKVNLNTASKKLLTTLNGIGDKTADKIIKYREENGKFETIYDILKIDGIGEKKFEDIKEYITVE